MAEKATAAIDDIPVSPEAVKTEESGRDGASSAERPSSPEPNCAICLSGPKNKSFTDSCCHQFCFTCLLEWSKVKAECPLCKQVFSFIIHNIRSMDDYDKYLVQSNPPPDHLPFIPMPNPRFPMPSDIFGDGYATIDQSERFRYRTTMVNSLPSSHPFHENVQQLIDALHNHQTRDALRTAVQQSYNPNNYVLPTTRSSRRRNALSGTSDFRRNIYRQNLWVRPQPDVTGRFRESTPEFYRLNEAATHRLVPWLNRELNVLVPNAEQSARVLDLILREIRRHSIRSTEFNRMLTPFIGSHTRHFLHEFYSFAISTFDMIGYDLQAQYVSYPELGHDPDVGLEISSDNDSDVQIVEMPSQPRNEDGNASSFLNQSSTVVDDGNDSDCIVVEEVNAANRPIELIDVLSDGESEADGTVESLPNPESITVNVSSLSSDDGFLFIDEFPQVKNTTIPKLKLRDLRELQDNPFLPSTSREHTRSIPKKSRVRKSRVRSLSLDTSSFHSDSSEEWRPAGNKMKRKKKKKKTKSCCCEKLKKHWKKECLSTFNSNSDSDTASNLISDSDSSSVQHRRCHPKLVQNSIRCKSGSNPKRKSTIKKKSKQRLSCDQDFPASFVNSDVSLSDSSCYSGDENECPPRQLRNKSKKSTANSEKKCGKSSKRKTASLRNSGKNKSRKHSKVQGSYETSSLFLSSESCNDYEPTSPISSTESEEWIPAQRKSTFSRSTSLESEGKSKKKKSKSSGKKTHQVRKSVITPLNSVINGSDIDLTPKNDRTVLIDESPSYFVPKIESCSSLAANPDSDLESNHSSSGRPRLKSVVRVVNPARRNSDSVPHYEIVSSSLCEPCPGPSTSRSSENSPVVSIIKSLLKKKT
nr:PREDICTED: E3 ubiquitin-protein ligase Topors-like [Bemisia tabaci]XP_018908382.1 PREDICTED: E3 ubiquitin-protein ligase Topors-like [Bemisia tabaci]